MALARTQEIEAYKGPGEKLPELHASLSGATVPIQESSKRLVNMRKKPIVTFLSGKS